MHKDKLLIRKLRTIFKYDTTSGLKQTKGKLLKCKQPISIQLTIVAGQADGVLTTLPRGVSVRDASTTPTRRRRRARIKQPVSVLINRSIKMKRQRDQLVKQLKSKLRTVGTSPYTRVVKSVGGDDLSVAVS